MEELQAQNEALKKQCNSLQKKIKQWKKEYEILDACIELEQGKMSELKAENDRLKEKIKMYKSEDTRKHNVIMETLQYEKKALDVSIKYKQILQEIKAIVCGNYEIIDPQGRKDILKLINKTEIK